MEASKIIYGGPKHALRPDWSILAWMAPMTLRCVWDFFDKAFYSSSQDRLFKVRICRAVFRRAGQRPYRRLAGLAATFH
jgi:hypothetical protein